MFHVEQSLIMDVAPECLRPKEAGWKSLALTDPDARKLATGRD